MQPNGKQNANARSAGKAEQELDKFLKQLRRYPRNLKRIILFEIMLDLLGNTPDEEVGIFDPDGNLFGYFVPPALRMKLRLLENPEFAAEMDRRRKVPGKLVPLEDVLRNFKPNKK